MVSRLAIQLKTYLTVRLVLFGMSHKMEKRVKYVFRLG